MMNTRTENIEGNIYCAYCGKELRSLHHSVFPHSPLICTCEMAKEELELYNKLRILYNYPLANDLIEKKVNLYRNQLLGITPPQTTYGITNVLPLAGSSMYGSTINTDYGKGPDNIAITAVNGGDLS